MCIKVEIKKKSNILNCVVILREDENENEKYLASYIILKEDKNFENNDAEKTKRFMEQASSLINGLSGETKRWKKQSNEFNDEIKKLVALACFDIHIQDIYPTLLRGSKLKYLIFIGETIDKEIFDFWIKNVDNFINGYETTVKKLVGNVACFDIHIQDIYQTLLRGSKLKYLIFIGETIDSISLIMIKSKILENGINFNYKEFYSNPTKPNIFYIKQPFFMVQIKNKKKR
jgi:hypothetical protein